MNFLRNNSMPKVSYKWNIYDMSKIEVFDDYAIAHWWPFSRIIPASEFGDYEIISE